MTDFQLAAIVLILSAALAFVNAKLFKLPSSVGLMATAMLGSILLLVLDATGVIDLTPRVPQPRYSCAKRWAVRRSVE
jgi:CPA1 family monovalent cation:H+ antiporter